MDKKTTGVLVAGLLITLIVFFFSIYLAGIVLILTIVLVMSLFIMQDSRFIPDAEASLRSDAKAIIIRNTGNARALNLHVALVPLNIEYDIPSLDVEAIHEYPLASMADHVKVVITFENEQQAEFFREHSLSSSGGFDPLRPMIPMFDYK